MALEEAWAQKIGAKHAVACNSATSGLLAAGAAVGIRPPMPVIVPCFTMSATAAAPAFLGAQIVFADVEGDYYCMRGAGKVKAGAIIAVNLFGQAAAVEFLRSIYHCPIIEDNAQAPFAKVGDKYAGTIGEIGIFSLNVHKHMQCGEGGIIVTDIDALAHKLRLFVNHGEMSGFVGLNLRMTEVTASIALAQLERHEEIIGDRVRQAEGLTKISEEFEWLQPPKVRPGCTHVYYHWPFTINQAKLGIDRDTFVRAMIAEGWPLSEGYVEPLYNLPAFQGWRNNSCATAEQLWGRDLLYFSNCEWTLHKDHYAQIREALKKVEANLDELRKDAA